MNNLLEETLHALNENNHEPTDVDFVSHEDGWMTWNEFVQIAERLTYYNGHGIQEIDSEVRVVGKEGWWLERVEYDGAEQWKYKLQPSRGLYHNPRTDLREHDNYLRDVRRSYIQAALRSVDASELAGALSALGIRGSILEGHDKWMGVSQVVEDVHLTLTCIRGYWSLHLHRPSGEVVDGPGVVLYQRIVRALDQHFPTTPTDPHGES